jgi:hypothetical protein
MGGGGAGSEQGSEAGFAINSRRRREHILSFSTLHVSCILLHDVSPRSFINVRVNSAQDMTKTMMIGRGNSDMPLEVVMALASMCVVVEGRMRLLDLSGSHSTDSASLLLFTKKFRQLSLPTPLACTSVFSYHNATRLSVAAKYPIPHRETNTRDIPRRVHHPMQTRSGRSRSFATRSSLSQFLWTRYSKAPMFAEDRSESFHRKLTARCTAQRMPPSYSTIAGRGPP